jgi:hypothetical protein
MAISVPLLSPKAKSPGCFPAGADAMAAKAARPAAASVAAFVTQLLLMMITGPGLTCNVATHAILALGPCEGTVVADLELACSTTWQSTTQHGI